MPVLVENWEQNGVLQVLSQRQVLSDLWTYVSFLNMVFDCDNCFVILSKTKFGDKL
jgi:hypothetical protein